jgi:uncharacterized LabA/DUF88 family protein
MAYANAYDTALLVSSDGDFAKVLRAVGDMGRHVEAACFRRAYHIKQAADRFVELNEEFLRPLWLSS